ncbi:hypothetical protein I5677_11570 [Mobilitalea sibirica]|uniref:Uncharacterized protein n=1 Tax=Mobilitalea sibirica TaxID=1462919 RepID=A0A8J7H3C0_9FIRM|nr:hypothetical protein [Mobilitalea sibirica]MBH1941533.1 hypothetical protein [Mobilitalea sibirica]
MKLRHKKIILLTIMGNMGIGIIALSLSQMKTGTEETLDMKEMNRIEKVDSNKDKMMQKNLSVPNEQDESTISVAIPSTSQVDPTLSPISNQYQVYGIEEDGYPEIEELVYNYFAAKINLDIDKLKSLSNDPMNIISLEQLEKDTMYEEDYRNIKCYIKKSYEEGVYIVYIYYETKITGITTLAPNLSKILVVTDHTGELKINDKPMDEKLKAYFDDRNNDADVQELIKMTNKEVEEAKAQDEELRNYWESITGT